MMMTAAGAAYGSIQATFDHVAVLKPPRITEKTVSVLEVFCSIRNEVNAVASEETATPARIRVVVGTVFPTRAIPYTTTTEIMAPTNAAIGSTLKPCHDAGAPDTTTIVAPSAAPVATPIRYGSASGLRKTPW